MRLANEAEGIHFSFDGIVVVGDRRLQAVEGEGIYFPFDRPGESTSRQQFRTVNPPSKSCLQHGHQETGIDILLSQKYKNTSCMESKFLLSINRASEAVKLGK